MTKLTGATPTQSASSTRGPLGSSVLIVDDDEPLRQRLAQAMETRGLDATAAGSVAEGLLQIKLWAPAYAVVEMRLGDQCGLEIISALRQQQPDARAIILTAYGNIATAVSAAKLGAIDYLVKPADPDDVISLLLAAEGCVADVPKHPMSPDRVRWEHIQHIYERCDRNVSKTARRLNMHRRSLQRALAKRAQFKPT
jgi:two-component system, response regulator RegA